MIRELKKRLLHNLCNDQLRRIRSEHEEFCFIILCDHYPEIALSPSPWPEGMVSQDEIVAFFRDCRFDDSGFEDLTDSGFRYKISLSHSSGVQHTAFIRRWLWLVEAQIR